MGFINNFLWKAKRVIIILFVLLLVASAIYIFITVRERSKGPIFSAIIDADTGNGISDLLAISRAVADPGFQVIGLTSVQWNHHPDATGKTIDLSQNLNDTLLKLFSREFITHPKGCEKMLNFENDTTLLPSEASEFIVKKANEASKDKKLNIITLGPLTNLAAAILSDSTIIPKLRIYAVAMQYDEGTKVWNKNEFNIRNDLDALDLVLNTDKLEIHIMPVSTSKELILDQDEIVDQMKNKGEPWNFLADLWINKYPDKKEIRISDIALIEAILKPGYAKEEQTNTPPENKSRKVFVYTSINKEFMKIDFWKAVKRYISENS